MLQRPLPSLLSSSIRKIVPPFFLPLLFQVRIDKDKELSSKTWTPPSTTLDRQAESRNTQEQSALGEPACLYPCTSMQRCLSKSCLSLLPMLRELVTPQSAEAEEINPFQDLFMSLPALASMHTVLQYAKPPRRGWHKGTHQLSTSRSRQEGSDSHTFRHLE